MTRTTPPSDSSHSDNRNVRHRLVDDVRLRKRWWRRHANSRRATTSALDVRARVDGGAVEPSASSVDSACGGLLQDLDVDLLHPEHGPHGPLGPLRVGVADELVEALGHDLPRQAEAVLHPPACDLLPTLGQPVPEVVGLLLVLAAHLERDRLGEVELGAAVEPGELLAVK